MIRMARENPRCGYFRIRGQLLKLDHTISSTTVRSVFRRSHVPPAGRRSQVSWRQFLTAHAESLVATDFFTVDPVFFKRLYVLFFVHLATRRVVAAACTAEPNSAWVTQQARNLSWKLSDEGINVRVEGSRPRPKVRPKLRRGLRGRRRPGDPDSADGTEGERPRRALGGECSARMPGLDADRFPASPGGSAGRILRALQR